MIMAKSRFCKGVNSKKKKHKIYAQDMTIIQRYKIAMFNFGAHGFNVKSVSPKVNHCNLSREERSGLQELRENPTVRVFAIVKYLGDP